MLLNSPIFLIFAFSFTRSRTTRDWRSFGEVTASSADLPFRRTMSFAAAVFLALFVAVAPGCGDRKSVPARGKDSSARIEPVDSLAPHEHDTIDAPKGVWNVRAVREMLEAAGLGPVGDESVVSLPFLGPSGTRLVVPGAEIQVYIYADALARARETDLIDSLTVAPPGGHVDWSMPASIIVTNNAALIVLTSDPFLRKRIHAAVRLHKVKQDQ